MSGGSGKGVESPLNFNECVFKDEPGSANCIILSLRLKEKYRNDDNSRISGPTLEDPFSSILTSTSLRHLLLSHQRHRLLLLLLHLLPR
jgi:hypothetical protein